MRDIDLDAAEVVHHLHQSLHIHRHVVIDGQLVLVVDDIRQSGNAAAVGEGHGVYLVVGGGVGLAVGKGDFLALGTHEAVAGDLEHPQRAALDVELAVEDHVRHAVVGGGVVGVVAAFFIVDAADEDVDHIALVFLEGLHLLGMEGCCRPDGDFLHPAHHADGVHHHARDDAEHRQRHSQRQPERGLFLFFLRRRGGFLPPAGVERGAALRRRCRPRGGEALRGRAFPLQRSPAGQAARAGMQEPFRPADPSGG